MADIPNPDKKVDETWKEGIEAERRSDPKTQEKKPEQPKTSGASDADAEPQEVSFSLFISTLAMQAYVALGELADPASQEKKIHLPQAKYMIDLIHLIHEKTKGNLSPDEEKMISGLLYQLQLKYVEKSEAT